MDLVLNRRFPCLQLSQGNEASSTNQPEPLALITAFKGLYLHTAERGNESSAAGQSQLPRRMKASIKQLCSCHSAETLHFSSALTI